MSPVDQLYFFLFLSLLLFSLRGSPVAADFLLSSTAALSSRELASSILSGSASTFDFVLSGLLPAEVFSSRVTEVLAVSESSC